MILDRSSISFVGHLAKNLFNACFTIILLVSIPQQ
jgi:hypothetical protein